MLYSIQDRDGEVYGTFLAPDTTPPLAPDEFAARLALEMADYPTAVEVEAYPLSATNPNGIHTTQDRLVINLVGDTIVFDKALKDVHVAVGIITLMNEINT